MLDVAKRTNETEITPVSDAPRSKEQTQLQQWLDADTGRAVLAHGRRGVGKQRLAEQLLRHARTLPQVVVLEGRAPEAGGRSFHPYAEIVHQAMAWAEQTGLTDTLDDDIYEGLSPVLEHGHAEENGQSLDQKLRFFDALRRLLSALGTQARLLMVIHDLERADSDTLELTTYLVNELFADPDLEPNQVPKGLLLLLLRDDVSGPAAREFLEEMQQQQAPNCLHLEGLDLEGLRRYVQSPHVLQKLLAASDGLPQEVDALIEALPNNVEELFERKLAGMDAAAQDTLRALAISGRAATARTLATVTGRIPKETARALGQLRDAHVVERKIHNGEFQFTFHRDRDLEVTHRSMSDEDRARYHGGWGQALSGTGEAGASALLAYHQLRSTEPLRGVVLAVQAAETYVVGGALNSAIEMLESARPHASGEILLSILERLAELAPLTGNPRRALGVVEQMKAALPDGERGIAHLKEAQLRNAAGEYDLALEALARARLSTGADQRLQSAQIEAAASEAYYHKSQRQVAAEAAQAGLEALAALPGEAPTRERIELHNQLGKIALADGDAERAIELFQETGRCAERSGLVGEQARALVNMGMVHMRRGESSKAEQRLLEGIELAQKVNDLTRLAFGYMNLGVLVHQTGELGRALDCYRECRSLFRRLGNRTQLARVLHNLGGLYLLIGDHARARAHNDEALRLARQSGVQRVVALSTVVDGIILVGIGEREAGESRLREGMRLQRKMGTERPVEAMIELAELKLQAGDLSAARELLGEVQFALNKSPSPLLSARRDLLMGRVGLQGKQPDAVEDLLRARDAFEGLNRHLFVRDVEMALVRARINEGRKEAARVHLDAAFALQREVAEDLPSSLAAVFSSGESQRDLQALEAELNGKPPAEVAPQQTVAAIPQGPAPRAPLTERKPEWAQRYGSIIGRSQKLCRVFHILDRVSQSDGTVLIYGESGTGKELIAEAVHRNSPRSSGPFVKLNCAALVESLLLSELFGHERGSFTGAHQRKIGRFEMAAGGTLFLDEIGDISPQTQVSLLRVLQEREFERVGGGRAIAVDARIIFATNRNLQQMVRDGTFREDLYYRLKGLTIELPPLRERPEDIVSLCEHFLGQYAKESGGTAKHLSPDAMGLLSSYGWPGNIRELENITRSVALFAEGSVISARDFDEYRELFHDGPNLGVTPAAAVPLAVPAPAAAPAWAATAPPTLAAPVGPPSAQVRPSYDGQSAEAMIDDNLLLHIFNQGIPLPELKKRIQNQAIARALRNTEGNITRAAEVLGMRRPRLSQIINADEELKALCQGANK